MFDLPAQARCYRSVIKFEPNVMRELRRCMAITVDTRSAVAVVPQRFASSARVQK
jgi:hypothetical protein